MRAGARGGTLGRMTIADPQLTLINRLRAMVPPPAAGPVPGTGKVGAGPGLFTYCALSRERIADVLVEQPAVGIVLEGRKELWLGADEAAVCRPGDAFIVPADTPLTAVNIPDPQRGWYRALIIEMGAAALPVSPRRAGPGLALTMTGALEAALWHAAQAIADAPSRPAVRQARLDELAALVLDDPVGGWLLRARAGQRLARLLAADPARDWTVDQAAAALGLGNATLRRRLAAEKTSFRALLRSARLERAHRVLSETGRSGAAAAAAGLRSRGHFARAYRARFGHNPAQSGPGLDNPPHHP